ncbi:S41 family peptidase [Sphingomonas koreensis]
MFSAALALAACPAGSITPAQAREDLELAISAAEAGLPDIYWRQTPEAWAWRKAEARALTGSATSEEMLFRALAPLMRGIGEGHLSVGRSEAMNCRYRASAKLFPLDLLWRDDGVFVTAGYGAAADVPTGSEVLSVSGADHRAMLEEMARVSAHDGDNRTGVMRDRLGRGYATARWWMRGDEPGYDVRLRLPGGRRVTRRLVPVPFGARPALPDAATPVVATLSWVNGDIAYLYVPTFSNKRYRAAGADYRATIQGIFETLAARRARNLILDLRDNGGGSEPNESILFSYLVAEPLRKYASVRSRPNRLRITSLSGKVFEHDIYDADELPTVKPGPGGDLYRVNAPPEGLMTRWERASPVFTGRLVVLAGGYTFSGGAELASMLRATNRGLFVGEEVGGTHGGNTSGYKWDLTLPNSGMEIGIPLLAFRFVWREFPLNHGALPHCFVQPAIGEERVAKDAAYDMAVQALGKRWNLPSKRAC